MNRGITVMLVFKPLLKFATEVFALKNISIVQINKTMM